MSQSVADFNTKDTKGHISIERSLLIQAKRDHSRSINLMFRQFIEEQENIFYVQYLGTKGLWGIGSSSFVCLTDRRLADITVGFLGEVTYEYVYLESITGGFLHQPSRLYLFLFTLLNIILILMLIFAVISHYWLSPFIKLIFVLLIMVGGFFVHFFLVVKVYYGLVKSGLVFFGSIPAPSIYIFANRKFLKRANRLRRELGFRRELRLNTLKEILKDQKL